LYHHIKQVFNMLLIAAAAAFLVTGCAGREEPAAPVQEIAVGIGKDLNEPKYAEIGVLSPNANIYESLVKLGYDYSVEPMLATRWEYRGDNTWRFYLREGVKFHNGREFTAEAVKYTLEQAMRPSGVSLLKIGADCATVVDDYTVDITTEEPNMRVPEILAHPLFGIRAPGTEPDKHPVGTGPFKFAGYEKEKQLVVERYEEYWGVPAKLDKITFKYIPDANTRIMALQAGEVDVISEVPRETVPLLKDKEGLKPWYSSVSSPAYGRYLVFETRVNGEAPQSIMQDARIRKAVGYAIDREAIVKEIWQEGGIINATSGYIPPEMLGSDAALVEGFVYDPAKAAALLDEAGWVLAGDGVRQKEGRRLEMTIVSGWPSAEELRPIPEIIQQQLKDAGIAVEIIEVSDGGLYDELLKNGTGDLWLTMGNQNNADPAFGLHMMHHSTGYYGAEFGLPWWGGEEFDRLVDLARAASDIREAKRNVAEALHVLVDEEASLIPVAGLYTVYMAGDRVDGLAPHPAEVSTRWDSVFVVE